MDICQQKCFLQRTEEDFTGKTTHKLSLETELGYRLMETGGGLGKGSCMNKG